MTAASFSCLVMSCKERSETLRSTLEGLRAAGWPEAPTVVLDDGSGQPGLDRIHRTWRRMIGLAARSTSDFVLLCEDDVVFGKWFTENLQSWPLLREVPGNRAFYASVYNPSRPFVLRALAALLFLLIGRARASHAPSLESRLPAPRRGFHRFAHRLGSRPLACYPMEMSASEQREQGSKSKPPFPSGLIAFIIALLAAVAFVVDGYFAIHRGREGCDGGTCVVAFYVGIAKALAALVIGFPTVWLLISLFRRSMRRLARRER